MCRQQAKPIQENNATKVCFLEKSRVPSEVISGFYMDLAHHIGVPICSTEVSYSSGMGRGGGGDIPCPYHPCIIKSHMNLAQG